VTAGNAIAVTPAGSACGNDNWCLRAAVTKRQRLASKHIAVVSKRIADANPRRV
jgi:hypothetical protein